MREKEFQHYLEAVDFFLRATLSGPSTGLCVSESSSNHNDPLSQSRDGLQLPTASYLLLRKVSQCQFQDGAGKWETKGSGSSGIFSLFTQGQLAPTKSSM